MLIAAIMTVGGNVQDEALRRQRERERERERADCWNKCRNMIVSNRIPLVTCTTKKTSR